MQEVSLSCDCGAVHGLTRQVSADLGTRIVCCCSDCQAFANFLQQGDRALNLQVLNSYGGTDIFQMPVSYLTITKGQDLIKCARLSAKGMHRWYAGCCNTPIGNTLRPGVPFIGLIHSFMQFDGDRDQVLGPVRAIVQTENATSAIDKPLGSPLSATLRTVRKLLVWKLRGLNQPSAFFSANGTPICEPEILQDKV